ncbi:MAG: single-stranded DNA-binding protein [Tannerella sp.]|jgi:single-strand DNA-binding protein|nr:single-stranded DNA-binding protein [Tannerella sp.]
MSLNKVILIGNVGKDPDIRYFDNGNAIANFSVATSERGYKLANGTEVPERTEWHNIVASRERAQFTEKYVKKGALVYVEGKIRTRNYDDKEGIKRYVTEILADRIEFYNIGTGRRDDAQSSTAETANTPLPSAPEVPPAPIPADDLPF